MLIQLSSAEVRGDFTHMLQKWQPCSFFSQNWAILNKLRQGCARSRSRREIRDPRRDQDETRRDSRPDMPNVVLRNQYMYTHVYKMVLLWAQWQGWGLLTTYPEIKIMDLKTCCPHVWAKWGKWAKWQWWTRMGNASQPSMNSEVMLCLLEMKSNEAAYPAKDKK